MAPMTLAANSDHAPGPGSAPDALTDFNEKVALDGAALPARPGLLRRIWSGQTALRAGWLTELLRGRRAKRRRAANDNDHAPRPAGSTRTARRDILGEWRTVVRRNFAFV